MLMILMCLKSVINPSLAYTMRTLVLYFSSSSHILELMQLSLLPFLRNTALHSSYSGLMQGSQSQLLNVIDGDRVKIVIIVSDINAEHSAAKLREM